MLQVLNFNFEFFSQSLCTIDLNSKLLMVKTNLLQSHLTWFKVELQEIYYPKPYISVICFLFNWFEQEEQILLQFEV